MATRPRGWTSFALFGETLLVGVLVGLASLPGVTALPALAAGVGHLRRHVDDEAGGLGRAVADGRTAWQDLWPVAVALPVVLAVLLLNVALGWSGAVPGARPVGLFSGLLAAALTVVAGRVAGSWRPGAGWREEVSRAGRQALLDPPGSAVLLVAVVGALLLAWAVPALTVVVAGLVVLAVLAVTTRTAPRG